MHGMHMHEGHGGQHFKYEDREMPYAKTPGPGKPQNAEQELALRMASLLRDPRCHPREFVVAFLSQDHMVQTQLAEIVFGIVQRWSNLSQYVTNPMNPLKEIYDIAARMVPPQA